METLSNLEAFVRSAEHGSFSEAARRMSLTPAAVSRNVAVLERNLGVRLFHRSTRRLTLTEAGETLRLGIADRLDGIQAAIMEASAGGSEPAGTLKVSLPPMLGLTYVLPLLPGFLERHPLIRPEWHFEGRPVDLVADGYDVAIGGGFDLSAGVVARRLAPAHVVAVASPGYLAGRTSPDDPAGLQALAGVVMRLPQTGRIRRWTMRDKAGHEMPALLPESFVVNDPIPMREATLLGLGVAMLAMPDVLADLDSGRLTRLLPSWYADAGDISLYYTSRALLPGRTRAFIDWITDAFRRQRLGERFGGNGL